MGVDAKCACLDVAGSQGAVASAGGCDGGEERPGSERFSDTLWGVCLANLEGLDDFDPHDPKQLGMLGEELAARYLACRGLVILERNWHTPYGEADLVCRDGDEVILVEVKTRLGADARPEEGIDRKKMIRYRNITLDYLREHEHDEQVRFDVMAVNVENPNKARVHHYMGVCIWEG